MSHKSASEIKGERRVLTEMIKNQFESGLLTKDDIKDPRTALLKLLKTLPKRDKDWFFTIDYTSSILEQAKLFRKKKEYDFSIIFFSVFFEHIIKKIIAITCERNNMNSGYIKNIVSRINWETALLILPVLGFPNFNEVHKNRISDLNQYRNNFVHYKWFGLSEGDIYKRDEKIKSLCLEIDKSVSYIKKYYAAIFFNKNKNKIERLLKHKK